MSVGWRERPGQAWTCGSTSRWRRVRRAYLAEHPCCEQCGAVATEVHHLPGTDYATQRYDSSTFQAICTSCHRKETQRQSMQARKPRSRMQSRAW